MYLMKSPKQAVLAKKFLDTIPPAMHWLRAQVRAEAQAELTIPQFRTLANINRGLKHVGEIAEHHGVSQPAMSRMVEQLVQRGLIDRQRGATDRREVSLSLTPEGKALFRSVKEKSQKRIARQLSSLTTHEMAQLAKALEQLERFIAVDHEKDGGHVTDGISEVVSKKTKENRP